MEIACLRIRLISGSGWFEGHNRNTKSELGAIATSQLFIDNYPVCSVLTTADSSAGRYRSQF